MLVFRSGVPIEVPHDYEDDPKYQAAASRMALTNSYEDAIQTLNSVSPDSWVAAGFLAGAPWARRYLNTTARLWSMGGVARRQADRGTKAMLRVLAGERPRVGRHRQPPLTAEQMAAAVDAVAFWRATVDRAWADEVTVLSTLCEATKGKLRLSAAHRGALRKMLRRRMVRKSDVALTLASWQVGVPLRKLRGSHPTADLVYG